MAGVTVLVAGGGTAGHIEPALAVADALRRIDSGIRIIALGTPKGLESSLIPQRGYQLALTQAIPLPRKLTPSLAALPARVFRSVRTTRGVVKRNNVTVVVGFGGYVALSAYLAAASLRVPVVIHEANATPGLANRLGAKLASVRLSGLAANGFGDRVVGTPVRESIAQLDRAGLRPEAREHFSLPATGKVVLVFGGSQGAQNINRALEGALPGILAQGIHVLHAYGRKNSPATVQDTHPGRYVSLPYIEVMDLAYAAADMVVARSGAITVAEVSSVGLPAVYVPLGHGNGEQAINALDAVNKGAAVLIADQDLTASQLEQQVTQICTDQQRYETMSQQAQGLGHADGADTVARIVLDCAHKKKLKG